MKGLRWLAPAFSAILLCGCATLPHFSNVITPQGLAPKVSDIVDEVQCEIIIAVERGTDVSSALAGMQDGQYVANINLTLDVTDNQGVNPSLSYINPFATANTNFTAALSAQVSGQQHRNFNVTFTLVFDKNTPTDDNLKSCEVTKSGSGLRGTLGVEEILASGLRYETGFKDANGWAYKIPAIGITTLLPSDPLTNSPALAPNFGSTVDFTLVYGAGIGPNWTLTHFVGVNPASGGLLSFMRTNKDTLVLSFARVGITAPPTPPAAATDDEKRASAAAFQNYHLSVQGAAKAALDNVTRMILQRLLPP